MSESGPMLGLSAGLQGITAARQDRPRIVPYAARLGERDTLYRRP